MSIKRPVSQSIVVSAERISGGQGLPDPKVTDEELFFVFIWSRLGGACNGKKVDVVWRSRNDSERKPSRSARAARDFVYASTSRFEPGDARLTEQPGNEGAGTGPSTPCPILETALFGVVAWLPDRCSVTSERTLEIDQVTSGKISSSLAEAKPDQSGKLSPSGFLLPVTQTHTTPETKRINTRRHSRSVVPQSFGEFLIVGFESKVQLDESGGGSVRQQIDVV